MNSAEVAKIADCHILNAVNRIEFQNRMRFDDPYKRLAAAIILQAAIDKLKSEKETSYWYYGRRVYICNGMKEDDYRFYADIAGVNYSWTEFLAAVSKNVRKRKCTDAAELIDILEEE